MPSEPAFVPQKPAFVAGRLTEGADSWKVEAFTTGDAMANDFIGLWSRRGDRAALIVFVVLAWIVILTGFGSSIDHRIVTHARPFTVLTYVHTFVFMAWLILFTIQVSLVEQSRIALHRTLGIAGLCLAGLMMIIGPATAIATQQFVFDHHGHGLPFLIVQLGSMVIFGGMVTAAALWRRHPAIHKRLMVLAMVELMGPAVFRLLIPFVAAWWPKSPYMMLICAYPVVWLMLLGLVAYDLIRWRRVNAGFAVGVPVHILAHLVFCAIYLAPGWPAVAKAIIGR